MLASARSLVARRSVQPVFSAVQARSFAAKKKADAGDATAHAPPIALFGLHAKYANALYTSASKGGELAKVEKDLNNVRTLLNDVPQFSGFLEDPTIPRSTKVKGLEDFLSKGKYSKTTTAFLAVVAENGRGGDADKIIDTFGELMMAHRGEVPAKVVSAEELTAKQVKALQESMKGYIAEGQTLSLTTEVDPSILGGLRVQVGDRYIDLSISTKINRIQGVLSAGI